MTDRVRPSSPPPIRTFDRDGDNRIEGAEVRDATRAGHSDAAISDFNNGHTAGTFPERAEWLGREASVIDTALKSNNLEDMLEVLSDAEIERVTGEPAERQLEVAREILSGRYAEVVGELQELANTQADFVRDLTANTR